MNNEISELADLLVKASKEEFPIEQIEEKRLEMINVILGPSFFGNEEFFDLYRLIEGCKEDLRYQGNTFIGYNVHYEFLDLEDKRKVILRRDRKYADDVHPYALVSSKRGVEISVHRKGQIPHSSKGSRIEMNIKTPEEVAQFYDRGNESKIFSNFCGFLTATTRQLIQEQRRLDSHYEILQHNLEKLKVVSEIET